MKGPVNYSRASAPKSVHTRFADMAGQRQRAACVLLLAALCGAHFIDAATFTETIDISWVDRWTHSSADKYTGKFVAEAPPGLSDVALKVRPAAAC